MTTAPRMLTTMAAESVGMLGVIQPAAACGQSTLTSASSAKNDRPTMPTKAIIQRSARL